MKKLTLSLFSVLLLSSACDLNLNLDSKKSDNTNTNTNSTKTMTESEKAFSTYVKDLGEVKNDNIEAKYIYDKTVYSSISEIPNLPAIGKYSDDLLLFYCVKGIETPSSASLEIICGTGENQQKASLYWWCSDNDPNEPIVYSYDAGIAYSKGYDDGREIFGFMACKNGLFNFGTTDLENLEEHAQVIENSINNNATSLDNAISDGAVNTWSPSGYEGYTPDGSGYAGSDGSVIYTSGTYGAYFDGTNLITWP